MILLEVLVFRPSHDLVIAKVYFLMQRIVCSLFALMAVVTLVACSGGQLEHATNSEGGSSSSGSLSSSLSSSSSEASVEKITSGRYAIFSKSTELVMEVAEYSFENGASIRLYDSLELKNQRFDIVDLENGYYSIMPVHSGKSLDVWNRNVDEGGAIRQYDYVGESQQQWEIRPIEQGGYGIFSRLSGKALTINSDQSGHTVQQADFRGGDDQMWFFEPRPHTHNFPELVWSEEFNYDGLPDPAVWGYEQGLVRNNEAQFYTSSRIENASVGGGVLTITAREEDYEGAKYTSASLHTRDKLHWTYGRFEVRAKIDVRAGMWPAIWMLGYGKWPESGEIDIMEYYGNKILANLAWKANNADPWSAAWDSSTFELRRLRFQHADWEDRFHVWRMDWNEEEIRLYVDDILLKAVKLNELSNPDGSNPFVGKPFYLLINLAIGGNNGGDPSATAFPGHYEIDYIRVYQ